MNNLILEEYTEKKELCEKFKTAIITLLEGILSDISIQNISGRIKDYDSLRKKIEFKKKYTELNDITDIIGIRVITYLPNDVDLIADKIRKEFNIDEDNSIDKRIHEYDKFGYMSLHLVCELNDERIKLTEYKKFKNMKFELQVRSILQHSWAEIEHDIGYKHEIGIPKHIKRRFIRLASLLELADEEFQTIVRETTEYSEQVSSDIQKNDVMSLELNKITLEEYIKTSVELKNIRDKIAKSIQLIVRDDNSLLDDVLLNFYLEQLEFWNYSRIEPLDKDIKDHMEYILKFAIRFFEKYSNIKESEGSIGLHIGIFYFMYIKALNSDESILNNFLNRFHTNSEDLLTRLIDTHKELSSKI